VNLAACAAAPDKIQANYVSPVEYSNLDCDQIRSELFRVSSQVRVLTGQQRRKHTNDQVAMGVGLVLFWPALFFLVGGDKRDQLAELKGQYDALNSVAITKKCAVADEIKAEQAAQASAKKK
jgi:hypothetical protein